MIGAPSTDTDNVHEKDNVGTDKYWSVSEALSHNRAPSSSTDQLNANARIHEQNSGFRVSDLNKPYGDEKETENIYKRPSLSYASAG